jgi:hypothetical protein
LVLGGDWLHANGLLGGLCKRLGITTPATPIELERPSDSEIKASSKYRQHLIDDLIWASAAKVNHKLVRFDKMGTWTPKRQHHDWRIELAAAFQEEAHQKLFQEADVTLPGEYWEYRDVFQPGGASGLPPHRKGFDHAIETEPDAMPPNLPQYGLSELELQATRDKI